LSDGASARNTVSDVTLRKWAFVGICIWIAVGVGLLWMGLRAALPVLFSALSGFIIAGLMCAFIRPITHALKRRGMGNGLATAIGMLTIIVGMIVIAMLFIGPVVQGVSEFVANAPSSTEALTAKTSAAAASLSGLPAPVQAGVKSMGQALNNSIAQLAKAFADFFIGSLASVFLIGINIFLGLVLTLWFLLDGEKVSKSMLGVVPARWRDDVYQIVTSFDRSFSGYLIGMAVGMAAIFVIAGVGFQIIGLPYGWFLAFLIAILDFIPYVGPILGGLLAILVGLTVSPAMAAMAGLIMLLGEQFTDSFLGPIIMGKAVVLHPLGVLFSLSIGIALAGFAGAILAIPVAAVVRSTYVYYMEKAAAGAATEQGAVAAT
jgi:predicted PurR-regulated permease PerM